jgi:molybdenum cofactor biosynthesis protein B
LGAPDHKAEADRIESVRVALVTVTDSRTEEDDLSGDTAAELFARDGHEVVYRSLIPNDREQILTEAESVTFQDDIHLTLFIGGTGIRPKDMTVDTIRPLLEKEISGFGELFRVLSYEEIGAAAMLSRAMLGTRGSQVVGVTPGSTGAVRLAIEQLILPEIRHMIWDLNR